MKNDKKIGLALSGGGYRAAAFHLGTLRKLNELGILENIDSMSTISGGSISGVSYLLNKKDFDNFENNFRTGLRTSVIKKIVLSKSLIFLSLGIILSLIGILYIFHFQNIFLVTSLFLGTTILIVCRFQFFFLPLTNLKIAAYNKIFFQNKTLNQLPDTPRISINASNLETGRLWTFSKNYMGDSSYHFPKDAGAKIEFDPKNFPIACAVASSTSVPVPFNPVKIPAKYYRQKEDINRIHPYLSDGGLYDNQGIHKLVEEKSRFFSDIIICSDGSQPFNSNVRAKNSFQVLTRATDIMMRKIKNLQFIRDIYKGNQEIAYFSLDWNYEKCLESFVKWIRDKKTNKTNFSKYYHFVDNLLTTDDNETILIKLKSELGFNTIVQNGLTSHELKQICGIKTNLTALSDHEINLLSNHAATLTELQVRLYCPNLF